MSYKNSREAIEGELGLLTGLQISKCWVFAGAIYLHFCKRDDARYPTGEVWMVIDGAWRLELAEGGLFTGLYDYGEPASDNKIESWTGKGAWGHLVQERLMELMRGREDKWFVNTGENLVVAKVSADSCNGFRMELTGGYVLAVFPASRVGPEWSLYTRETAFKLHDGKLMSSRRGRFVMALEQAER